MYLPVCLPSFAIAGQSGTGDPRLPSQHMCVRFSGTP